MNEKALLVYDGSCPMCQRARAWAEKHIPESRLETMACQDDALSVRAPQVTREACMEAMQLLMPDGRICAGERAFPPLLRLTRLGRYFAWCFALPGSSLVYRLIARNRHALSALFFRKTGATRCSLNDGCE